MFKKNFPLFIVAFMAISVLSPAVALASRGSDDSRQGRVEDEKQFGIEIGHHNRGGRGGDQNRGREDLAPRGIVKGPIQSKSDTGFVVKSRSGDLITVNTANAVMIKIPNQTITLADLAVNDFVSVLGVKTNSTVNATRVYLVPQNIFHSEAKGIVTAKNGNDLTIQTRNGKSVTVKTDAQTLFVKPHGQTATLADVVVGAKIQIKGVWDSVADTFQAIKVKIRK